MVPSTLVRFKISAIGARQGKEVNGAQARATGEVIGSARQGNERVALGRRQSDPRAVIA